MRPHRPQGKRNERGKEKKDSCVSLPDHAAVVLQNPPFPCGRCQRRVFDAPMLKYAPLINAPLPCPRGKIVNFAQFPPNRPPACLPPMSAAFARLGKQDTRMKANAYPAIEAFIGLLRGAWPGILPCVPVEPIHMLYRQLYRRAGQRGAFPESLCAPHTAALPPKAGPASA